MNGSLCKSWNVFRVACLVLTVRVGVALTYIKYVLYCKTSATPNKVSVKPQP